MTDSSIKVRATEVVPGERRLWITTRFATSLWSIEDATTLLEQLAAALERAIDPSPLPEDVPEPRKNEASFPIWRKPAPPTLEDVL